MKLISLNIWDARIFDPLISFFENNQDIDIFCLQEVFNGTDPVFFRRGKRMNGFSEISACLLNHNGYFKAAEEALDDEPARGLSIPYGLAIFVKKGITVTAHHHSIVFGNENDFSDDDARTHKRIVQTICVQYKNKPLAISNFHGLWNGQGKTDTQERIEQSNKLKSHLKSFNHDIILAGDFNLLPDTKSLAIVSEGMRDLIKENNIKSTRSKLYTKHENPVLFADYIFTSPDIEVKSFNVLFDVVSDHLPLLVEF